MKNVIEFIKLTILGGVLFVLPVILIYVLLTEALEGISGLAGTAADLVGFAPPHVLEHPHLYALAFLILLSFAVGLAMRTPGVKRLIAGAEKHILGRIPGYRVIRTMTQRLGGDAWYMEFSRWHLRQGLCPARIRPGGWILFELQ